MMLYKSTVQSDAIQRYNELLIQIIWKFAETSFFPLQEK